jgi:hypothetical protein
MEEITLEQLKAFYVKEMVNKDKLKIARQKFVQKHKDAGDFDDLKREYNRVYYEKKRAKKADNTID